MRFLIRLLGALWLATLVVSAAFAWYEVTEERTRLAEDLQRRAVLAADAVREASERLVARGARTGYERVFMRFSRPDRTIAIYDAFGSVIDATASVKTLSSVRSPRSSPTPSSATRPPAASSRWGAGGRWCTWCRCSRTSAWSAPPSSCSTPRSSS